MRSAASRGGSLFSCCSGLPQAYSTSCAPPASWQNRASGCNADRPARRRPGSLMAVDPIHQFEIQNLFSVGKIAGTEIYFTNSALFMLLSVVLTALLLLGTTTGRRLVPSRLQSLGELSYEFVASTIRQTAGEEGMRFFPLVFSLFMFILVSNMLGLIPYTFTVASHIIVTVALALLVF